LCCVFFERTNLLGAGENAPTDAVSAAAAARNARLRPRNMFEVV